MLFACNIAAQPTSLQYFENFAIPEQNHNFAPSMHVCLFVRVFVLKLIIKPIAGFCTCTDRRTDKQTAVQLSEMLSGLNVISFLVQFYIDERASPQPRVKFIKLFANEVTSFTQGGHICSSLFQWQRLGNCADDSDERN